MSLFPFLLPSEIDPNSNLIVWDASSSAMTLLVMTIATVILLPIVLAYTVWVSSVLPRRVTAQDIESDPHTTHRTNRHMWYFSSVRCAKRDVA